MTPDFDFTPFLHLVDFLAGCFDDNTEIVLHDFTDISHSIVKIHNGHITGRSVGGPLTSFALSKLKDKGKEGPPYYLNYPGLSRNNTPLRSSSCFLLDRTGNPRGMLCVNTDVEKYRQAEAVLHQLAFLPSAPPSGQAAPNVEAFQSSPRDLIDTVIAQVTRSREIAVDRLTFEEKMEVVRRLNEDKLFLLKGAVNEVASVLGVSVPTMYRYLKKITDGGIS